MTSTDQMVFCRFPSDESLAAVKFWNTPTSRSARKPAPEFTRERSSHSSADETQQEKENSRRLRFAANRSMGAPADPPSQGYQYARHHHWEGADLQLQAEAQSESW